MHVNIKQAREPVAILIAFFKCTFTPASVEFDGRIDGEPRPCWSLPGTSRLGRRVPTAGPEELLEQERLPKAGEDGKAGLCLKEHGNALEGDKAIGGIGESARSVFGHDVFPDAGQLGEECGLTGDARGADHAFNLRSLGGRSGSARPLQRCELGMKLLDGKLAPDKRGVALWSGSSSWDRQWSTSISIDSKHSHTRMSPKYTVRGDQAG